MIKTVKTLFTIKEMTTDGHAPVLFHCDDANNYYCKYRIYPRPQEINCLAFEIIASQLLKQLKLPTPEIALVQIAKGTLDKRKIKKNLRMKEGMLVFGSKAIQPSRLLTGLDIIHSKNDFNRILNPADLVRIALFDLWVKNGDRGRIINEEFTGHPSEHNYNLLLRELAGKIKITAFDHGFIFGGSNAIGNFHPNMAPEGYGNLYQTPFYRSVVRYLETDNQLTIINNFVTLLPHDYSDLIQNVFQQLPKEWNLNKEFEGRIIDLLSNRERIQSLAQALKNATL